MITISNFLPKHSGRNLILLFCLINLITACKVAEIVEFEVLRPPSVIIPADVITFAFVDRNLKYEADSVNQYFTINGRLKKDRFAHDSLIKMSCYLGFKKNFSEYLQLDTLPFVRLAPILLSDSVRTYPKLAWDKVDSICALNNSDNLIVLEGNQVKADYTIIYEDNYSWFANIIDVKYWAFWRIYDPLYQQVRDEFVFNDSLVYRAEGNSIYLIRPFRAEVFKAVAFTIGENYVKRILPQWGAVKRRYYCTGDEGMDTAFAYLNQYEADLAICFLEAIVLDTKKKNRVKGWAAYDLAVAYELKGDLQEALKWNRESIKFFKQMKNSYEAINIAESYAVLLKERQKDEMLLKSFWGE